MSRGRRRPSRPAATRRPAIVTYLTPGLRFFHQGQFEGRKVHVSPTWSARQTSRSTSRCGAPTTRLLAVLREPALRDGDWHLLECRPAWDGNPTWDDFVAWEWRGHDGRRFVIAVNLGPTQGQCYVSFPVDGLDTSPISLVDRMSGTTYEREVDDLTAHGLYLDLPSAGYDVFEVASVPITGRSNGTTAAPPRKPRAARRASPAVA